MAISMYPLGFESYRILGSALSYVNGIYTCRIANRCDNANGKYTLSASNQYLKGLIQKIWYIRNASSNELVFGALELSNEPWLLKEWKHIGVGFDFVMKLQKMNTTCEIGCNEEEVGENWSPTHQIVSCVDTIFSGIFSIPSNSKFESSNSSSFTTLLLSNADALLSMVLAYRKANAAMDPSKRDHLALNVLASSSLLALCESHIFMDAYDDAMSCYEDYFQLCRDSKIPVSLLDRLYKPVGLFSLNPLNKDVNTALNHSTVISACAPSAYFRYSLLRMRGYGQALDAGIISAHSAAQSLRPLLSQLLTDDRRRALGYMSLLEIILTGVVQSSSPPLLPPDGGAIAELQAFCQYRDPNPRLLLGSGSLSSKSLEELVFQVCGSTRVGESSNVVQNKFSNLDIASSMVLSLLSLGDPEAAAVRMLASVSSVDVVDIIDVEAAVDILTLLLDKRGDLVARLTPSSDVRSLLCHVITYSANVRAAVRIYSKLIPSADDQPSDILLRNLVQPQLSGLLLNVLFQTCTPTILSTAAEYWAVEASVLRLILMDVLDRAVAICTTATVWCDLGDPQFTIGARGLFLLAYQGLSILTENSTYAGIIDLEDSSVPAKYFQLVQAAASDFPLQDQIHITHTQKAKKKVGFLSAFFFRHPVGRLLGNVIIGLSRERFDVYLLRVSSVSEETGPKNRFEDDLSEAIVASVPVDHRIQLRRDVASATRILHHLALDVIVFGDLFMDSFTAHLAMNRLADCQVTFWGHPFTSGYPTVDYFISSVGFEYSDPRVLKQIRGRAERFTEQIVLFDSLSFSMYPDTATATAATATVSSTRAPAFSASPPAPRSRSEFIRWLIGQAYSIDGRRLDPANVLVETATGGAVRIYGCYQSSLMKMHPLFDKALLKILQLDELALILLSRNMKQANWQMAFQQRLKREASAEGASNLLNRVIFLDQLPHDSYIQVVCGCDVTLDPFPFGGGVTLADSLSCGGTTIVPFVTCSTLQTVHKIGAAIAQALGNVSSSPSNLASDACMHSHSRSGGGEAATTIEYSIDAYSRWAVDAARNKSTSTINTVRERRTVYTAIYDSTHAVVAEWEQFLDRI